MKRMKKEWGSWFLIGSATFLFIIFLVGFEIAISENGPGSGDAAGWAQAIGAFIGIGVVIALSRIDIDRQKQKKDSEHASLAKGIFAIATQCVSLTKRIENGSIYRELLPIFLKNDLSKAYTAFITTEAREMHSILAGFPIDRLAELGLTESVLHLRLAMNDLIQWMPHLNIDEHGCPQNTSQFQKIKNLIEHSLQELGHGNRWIVNAVLQ